LLATTIDAVLKEAESKIWHPHPICFLDGNPIVVYSKQKLGLRLMFWSGASFEDEKLNVIGKNFKEASIFCTSTAGAPIERPIAMVAEVKRDSVGLREHHDT
jgi:hypothetical protein